MNKTKFIIYVADRVISVARLIREATELLKMEIDSDEKNLKSCKNIS